MENNDPPALINNAFDSFYRAVFRAVKVNIALANNGEELILGDPAESFIVCRRGKQPHFNSSHFRARLKTSQRAGKCYGPKHTEVDAYDQCHGKVAAAFGYRALVYVLGQYSKVVTLPKQFATGLAITSFLNGLRKGDLDEYRQYYQTQFAAL